MVGVIALLTTSIFVAWLFARDSKLRPMSSPGVWIPFTWFVILGTRPLSSWIGYAEDVDSADSFMEGNPLDRNTLIVLMLLGVVVLLRRRTQWGSVLRANFWFTAFFVYCAISVVWSDYPFVSFKRWVREFGNVIMILIILAEADPGKATRALLARFAYLVIPFSAVVSLYFPSIGTYYSSDISSMAYSGVTQHKNMLGSIMFISGLYLAWELLYLRRDREGRWSEFLVLAALFSMAMSLMVVSQSSTSLICLMLGVAVLLLMKLSCIKRHARHLGFYGVLAAVLLLALVSSQGIVETITGAVGRDLTFTGRTELWADVLREPVNPLLGTGYQSFWLGARADDLWERYLFHPRQSHNGYLETYLNGGLLGLFLLLGVILSIGMRLKKGLEAGNSFAILLFTFWIAALFYNFTESRFAGPNLIWIMLSLAALYRPPQWEPPELPGYRRSPFNS